MQIDLMMDQMLIYFLSLIFKCYNILYGYFLLSLPHVSE